MSQQHNMFHLRNRMYRHCSQLWLLHINGYVNRKSRYNNCVKRLRMAAA